MEERTMPFRPVEVQLESAIFSVTPGNSVVIPFTLVNHTNREDYFDISVQGIPENWVLFDMPVVRLTAGERREVSLTVQAPGTSPLSAGVYPVTIRATSQAVPSYMGDGTFDLRVGGYVVDGNTVPFQSGGAVDVMMETLQYAVTPGESLSIPFMVANHGVIDDTFTISVTGLPAQWLTIPVAAVRLQPEQQREITVVIQPLQGPDSRAGRHPFQVRIASQVDPAQVALVDAVLTVGAFSQYTSDLHPRNIDAGKLTRVSIHNMGNIQETYTLRWQSPGDVLEFVPSPVSPLHILPGQSAAMDFTASPRRPNWFGGPLHTPYTVLVQSSAGETQAHSGEVYSRSLIPVWVLPVLLVFCLATICGLGFLWNWNQGRLTGAKSTADTAIAIAQAQTATALAGLLTPTAGGPIPPTATFPATATQAPSPTAQPPSATPVPPTATVTAPAPTSTFTLLPPTSTLPPPTNTPLPPTPTLQPPSPTPQASLTPAPVTAPSPTSVPLPVTGQQLFVFMSNRDGHPQLYLFNTSDGSLSRLTNDGGNDTQAAWSPDGKHILFTSSRDGNNEIYIMNADGSNQVNLTRNAADDSYPAWSPDGKQVAFTTNRDGNNEIYVMNADGSNPVNLTKAPANDYKPAWYIQAGLLSSTSRILFTTDRDGNNEIYAINPDGSNPVNLTKNAASDQMAAVPFGGVPVVFVTDRDGNAEIYEMNLDGSNPTNLTKNPAEDTMPALSPDGKWVAFTTTRDGNREIYIMGADGSKQTNLTRSPADESNPAWR